MKKYINSLVLFMLGQVFLCSLLFPHSSSESLSYSGSYSTRAYGSAANYWNPANLSFPLQARGELLLINSYFSIDNNSFSVSRYNEINGSYLTENDKRKIIKDLDGSLKLNTGFSHSIFGLAIQNWAISAGISMFSSAKLSDKYIDLLLFGNEYDYEYVFDENENSLDILSYGDLTFGISPYSFELHNYTIHTGVSFSLLYGIATMSTENYYSEFHVSDEGIALNQEILLKSGFGGSGIKTMLGLRSDLSEDLSLAFTLDNLPGFIHWHNQTERTYYTASVDSVYISSLNEEIISHSDSTYTIDAFTTTLPLSFNFGALYRIKNANFSLDWKQSITNTVTSSKTPEISMACEYLPKSFLSLRFGIEPGLGEKPYGVSYGFGILTNDIDVGFGIKSYRAIFPSSYSRGLALALTSKWRF